MSLIHLRIYIIPTNEETATSDFVGFLIMELWKKIKEFENYEVSNFGAIRRKYLYNLGTTQKKIAEMYNVHISTISLLVNNKTYTKWL